MVIALLVVLGGLFLVMLGVLITALVAKQRGAFAPPPRPVSTLDDVRSLARAGRKADAIRVFRQVTGQGLTEAKAAVEQMSGRAPVPRKQGLILREVRDADIESQIRLGHLMNAIALYREKTGVGPQEARTAVERWRDRLHAS
jgi:ribosomal protein L7/L12